jgi:hypothetical protein
MRHYLVHAGEHHLRWRMFATIDSATFTRPQLNTIGFHGLAVVSAMRPIADPSRCD